MNVLVVAPHPDDEAIGCGGAICLHVARGDRVTAVFLTSGELGLKHLPREEAWHAREAEARAAGDVLGFSGLTFLRSPDWTLGEHIAETAEKLQTAMGEEKPDVLYVPHPADAHPDHRAALPIVRRALRGYSTRVFGYEVWTPLAEFDEVKDISAVMERKLDAVRRYQSQLGYFQYERGVRGLNEYRGAMAGHCQYAEVFRQLTVDGEEAR
jgi:LmbE family N-acetylglucosaminyl deacetylase